MAKKQMRRSVSPPSAQRRWNPYICQDCRAIFRVPADYEGAGVVCPKCDIMLRLPKAGEAVPAATINGAPHISSADPEAPASVMSRPGALEPAIAEDSRAQAQDLQQEPVMSDMTDAVKVIAFPRQDEPPRRRKKHRRKPDAEEMEWKEPSTKSGSLLSSVLVRRILFATIGMGFILLLLLASSFFQRKPKASVALATPVVIELTTAKKTSPGPDHANHVNEFPAIEKVVKAFLEARTPEEMLLHVRQSAMIKERVLKYYQAHSFQTPGFSRIDDATMEFSHDGNVFTAPVVTSDFSQSGIAVVRESGQYAVDWESWVGWSEMTFEELMQAKPTTPVEMRVVVEDESYYNFDFPPEAERLWQSYRLVGPDGISLLHGYVEKASELDNALHLSPDQTSKNVILRVKYRENSTNDKQVLVDSIVADGWLKLDVSK